MFMHDEADVHSEALAPLLRAVVEALGDSVVVFDREGRVVYATAGARAELDPLVRRSETGAALILALVERGGRRVPLQLGRQTLGEAVFLPVAQGTLAERERLAILSTLQTTQWRLAEVARHLGISRTTLWRRLKAYGVRRDGGSSR